MEIGGLNEALYPLNNNAVKELFGTELAIEKVASETFVQNLALLFKTKEGIKILEGNIKPLESIIYRQGKNYTSELVQKQTLEAATNAWEANDYVNFIKFIDKIGIDKLPQSYQLKYNIVRRKLNS